jgi:hypothetical protein
MTETYISLYDEKAEAFERVKEEIGPEGVTPNNTDALMRLIEHWEEDREPSVSGGLTA